VAPHGPWGLPYTPAMLRRTAALAAMGLAVTAAGCWTQPGFDALHQGNNTIESGLTLANVSSLDTAWSATVGDGGVRGEPVVADGLVHVTDDLSVYGFDTQTGARRYRTPVVPPAAAAAGAVAGPVTIDGGTLLVPWAGAPDSGAVVSVDAATGQILGTTSLEGARSVTLRPPWRAINVDGLVEGSVPGGGVRVDGPVSWFVTTHFGGTAPVPGPTPATLTSSRVLVGLAAGFYGTDVLAGWDLDPGCPSTVPPGMCTPDLRTQLDGAPTTPSVAGDEATVYVGTSAGTVYAVDGATGAVRWTGAAGAPIVQRLAVTPDVVFAATADGHLVSFAAGGCGAATCAPVRTVNLGAAPAATPPAVAGGVVYAVASGFPVSAFPAAGPVTGPLWSASYGSRISAGPTVAFGTVYVGTSDGQLVGIRRPGT
jgi:outer membrane protein assembly factor BamB